VLADDAQESERIIRRELTSHGIEVLDLISVKPTLEDAFIATVEEKRKQRSSMGIERSRE
jgi:hypothetical protein